MVRILLEAVQHAGEPSHVSCLSPCPSFAAGNRYDVRKWVACLPEVSDPPSVPVIERHEGQASTVEVALNVGVRQTFSIYHLGMFASGNAPR
jgi:hypothetical protein